VERVIFFIDEIEELKEYIKGLLSEDSETEVLISGTFDNEVYQEIIERMLLTDNIKKSKIIIPMVGRNGVVSRSYITKICSSGGHMKINSKYRNNIVVIGDYALILSFSSRHYHDGGIKAHFESCVVTNDKKVVEKIINKFVNIWNYSLPLVEN